MSIIQATKRRSAAFLKGLRDNGKECGCHTCRLFEWHDDASRLAPFFSDVLCEERLSAARSALTVVDSSETILRSAETTPDSNCLSRQVAPENVEIAVICPYLEKQVILTVPLVQNLLHNEVPVL